MPSEFRDPREIITPDAFRVADHLIGTPLATPMRRLAAILVDLVIVGILALLLKAPGLVLATIGAWLVWRLVRGTADRWWKRLFRGAFGCLGALLVFAAVLSTWSAVFDEDQEEPSAEDVPGIQFDVGSGDWGGVFTGARAIGDVLTLRNTSDSTARAEAAQRLVGALAAQSDVSRSDLLELANEAAANATSGEEGLPSASWQALAHAASRKAGVDSLGSAAEMDPFAGDPLPGDSMSSSGDSLPGDSTVAIAADAPPMADARDDSIAALQFRVTELQEDLERQQAIAAEVQEELEARDQGPIRRILGGIADDMGVGFGWLAFYFTAFTVLGRGQTPGKKLLRIRVIRLDARPVGWWLALQRFGGYAASFVTGLIGFLEIFWDDNRQGLQDKLVHSVVIDERHRPTAATDDQNPPHAEKGPGGS